jgi:hypothetical protein
MPPLPTDALKAKLRGYDPSGDVLNDINQISIGRDGIVTGRTPGCGCCSDRVDISVRKDPEAVRALIDFYLAQRRSEAKALTKWLRERCKGPAVDCGVATLPPAEDEEDDVCLS